jgi:D-glycero-alpha-D-manno-heptose 1-phosphate guanylyltransferase
MQTSFQGSSVAILAGGLGTRLRSVVEDRPKVLAPVAGRPFLAYLLDQLSWAGVRKTVLLGGFGADQLHEEFSTQYAGMKLEYSVESEPLGTAGAIRLALPFFEDETILILNGDSYCDVNLQKFWQIHQGECRRASMVLTQVENASRFGEVQLGPDDCIARFKEKNPRSGPGWINAGIYLLERNLIEEMNTCQSLSLERDILPNWVAKGSLFGFRAGTRFIDIGVPESYSAAERFFSTLHQ